MLHAGSNVTRFDARSWSLSGIAVLLLACGDVAVHGESPSAAEPAGSGGAPPAMAGTSGSDGAAGSQAAADASSMAAGSSAGSGEQAAAGSGGLPGDAGDGSVDDAGSTVDAGTPAVPCCADGDCLCPSFDPTELTAEAGPYAHDETSFPGGSVFVPLDATPPFAAIALGSGGSSSTPELIPWGRFFASHGMVMVLVNTSSGDLPEARADKLLEAVAQLKAANTDTASPLFEKLSGRYGVAGYSIGAGGVLIAAARDSTLATAVGLATWGESVSGVTIPTLLSCGDADPVAPCDMSRAAYDAIADPTPKMLLSIPGATHFTWYDPKAWADGMAGQYVLAFQKVFLEGDERWRRLLLQPPAAGTQITNMR